MAWEEDWLRWTHVTYGLIQSVSLADKLDGGNLETIQRAVADATSWSTSSIGFTSELARRGEPQQGSIKVDGATGVAVVDTTKSSVASLLLVGTLSVTETLLSEIMIQKRIVKKAPPNFSAALESLRERLAKTSDLVKYEWAINCAHEARILRNVIVHAEGTWAQRALEDFRRFFPAKIGPAAGTKASINVDDLFAYRRAMRTVLNAAARA